MFVTIIIIILIIAIAITAYVYYQNKHSRLGISANDIRFNATPTVNDDINTPNVVSEDMDDILHEIQDDLVDHNYRFNLESLPMTYRRGDSLHKYREYYDDVIANVSAMYNIHNLRIIDIDYIQSQETDKEFVVSSQVILSSGQGKSLTLLIELYGYIHDDDVVDIKIIRLEKISHNGINN